MGSFRKIVLALGSFWKFKEKSINQGKNWTSYVRGYLVCMPHADVKIRKEKKVFEEKKESILHCPWERNREQRW